MILLAHRGVTTIPFDEVRRWSNARATAAQIVLAEAEGGRWNAHTQTIDWPKP